MTTINEIFRTFGPEYLERYSKVMPNIHRKVIDAIIGCRTEACGVALYECEKCGQLHRVYRSCLPVRAARRQVEIAIALLVNTIKPGCGWRNK
jgi:hypothetical protein